MVSNVFKRIGYLFILVLSSLYFVNEIHFYLNKDEISAEVIELIEKRKGKYDKVVIAFSYKNRVINETKSIKRSVYNAIKGKPNIVIFYDDFLIKDLYFKDRHPYFIAKLIMMFVVYITVLISLILGFRTPLRRGLPPPTPQSNL